MYILYSHNCVHTPVHSCEMHVAVHVLAHCLFMGCLFMRTKSQVLGSPQIVRMRGTDVLVYCAMYTFARLHVHHA
jgi:hypothetical protein